MSGVMDFGDWHENYTLCSSNTWLCHSTQPPCTPYSCKAKDLLTEDRFHNLSLESGNAISLCAVDDYLGGKIIHRDATRGCVEDYPWWDLIAKNPERTGFLYDLSSWAMPRYLASVAGDIPSLDSFGIKNFLKKIHDSSQS